MSESTPKARDRNPEYLKMEYEQTVQTLRNWDTLFFNALSSVIIAGGIGGVVAWEKTADLSQLKTLKIVLPLILYFVFLLYVAYNLSIAKQKFDVVRRIEEELNLIGAYQKRHTWFLYFLLFPLFTISFVIYLCLVLKGIL